MDETRAVLFEQVRRIVFDQLPDKPAKLYVFGSWARGEARQSSDIDVAIEFAADDEANRRALVDIRDALEESTIPYRIDVVDLNRADAHIVQKVREEGVVWDERMSAWRPRNGR